MKLTRQQREWSLAGFQCSQAPLEDQPEPCLIQPDASSTTPRVVVDKLSVISVNFGEFAVSTKIASYGLSLTTY